jgi:hypothetical protein
MQCAAAGPDVAKPKTQVPMWRKGLASAKRRLVV